MSQSEREQIIGRLVMERAEALKTRTITRAALEEVTKALVDVTNALQGGLPDHERLDRVLSNPALAKYADMERLRELVGVAQNAKDTIERVDQHLKTYGIE